ncbi:hypothetical protein Nepgr_018267 [Nepenthes gracilis]|uniref:WRKY19-like zinc finger domain-containing protein n=1 Tax=Nepenthes gracilis TaxID=150966 RepID=A0AAD3XU54_NEPGR|nr:hypothetical protein Nepgr_018267 [Nepenthes gracilis]
MDLNQGGVYFSCISKFTRDNRDTTLRLDCLGNGRSNNSKFQNAQSNLGALADNQSDDGCRLLLGLGPTPRAYHQAEQNEGSPSSLLLGLSSRSDSILKLGLPGGTEAYFGSLELSASRESDLRTHHLPSQVSADGNRHSVSVLDEGSTSAKKSGGFMPSLLLAPRIDNGCEGLMQLPELMELNAKTSREHSQLHSEPSDTTCFSVGTTSEPSTVVSSDQKPHNSKRCMFIGCTKGARGATGLCIGHGGGQRCQKPGCNKGSESRTAYCKAHGGGRRCQHLGCTKSAEGKTDFCIAHGGGRRCGHPSGCSKAARGKSGFCIRHGGGKRCKIEGCARSAEGHAGLCISHGGGRRCQFLGCTKGAQGSTMFCKAHGGGKRCIFAGCTKGAEGSTPLCKGHGGGKRCLFDGGGICPKSVHGGTNFCVAHGGGKRCAVPGCTKSARGRTDSCVRHGGGKRCRVENCMKSAQGSTDFCKAHGGGKRCGWGDGKCEKFARGKSGLCAAHGSLVQRKETKKGTLIRPGLFQGLVSAALTVGSSCDRKNSSCGVSIISDGTDSFERPNKRQHLIPPQVLVPLSMRTAASYYSGWSSGDKQEEGNSGRSRFELVIPEGRVHGGGLMSLLGGNLKDAVNGM